MWRHRMAVLAAVLVAYLTFHGGKQPLSAPPGPPPPPHDDAALASVGLALEGGTPVVFSGVNGDPQRYADHSPHLPGTGGAGGHASALVSTHLVPSSATVPKPPGHAGMPPPHMGALST